MKLKSVWVLWQTNTGGSKHNKWLGVACRHKPTI